MRIVDLNKFLEFRKRLDRRLAFYYSAIVGIVFFVLVILSNPLQAFIWSIVLFLLSYGIIYGIRVMTNNGAESKRSKAVTKGAVLDVNLKGEFGLLSIEEDKINYISLQKFGLNKTPEILIDEDLFMGIARYKFGKLQKLKLGKDVKCQLTFKSMPHGMIYLYDFYDVDGAFDKMTELLDKISQFNLEKHQ